MNPKYIFSLLIICLFALHTHAQEMTAGEYLTAINQEQAKISQDMMQYISAANHGKSARKVEKRRAELIEQVKESERTIRRMKSFKGNTQLRDSTAKSLRVYQIILNQDYAKIVNMEEIAEQSYDAMEAYMMAKDKAHEKMEVTDDAAEEEFKKFASANNIKIVENGSKTSEKLKASGMVNKYYNQIYLIFFKSYKNEAYMMDALNKGDVNALEQTRNALLTSAMEDLVKIGPMQGFNGDVSLKNGCQQYLNFCKMEASQKIPLLIEFLLSKEKFDKAKKAIDSKKETERTQEDIDAFNKAVKEYNAAVNKSNQVNKETNEKRSSAYKIWIDAGNNFLDRHTPK